MRGCVAILALATACGGESVVAIAGPTTVVTQRTGEVTSMLESSPLRTRLVVKSRSDGVMQELTERRQCEIIVNDQSVAVLSFGDWITLNDRGIFTAEAVTPSGYDLCTEVSRFARDVRVIVDCFSYVVSSSALRELCSDYRRELE
jgi:hypothetical protein